MGRQFTRAITASDQMVGLVNEDFNILPILSRFSIPLGFGSKTIGEVCDDAGIDTSTFLLIVNFILSGKTDKIESSIDTAVGIVDFLHNSHDYFLGYKFPHIRHNLLEALDAGHSDINPAIMKFFDEYLNQVKKHFSYEERKVWPYIRGLQNGSEQSAYNIEIFKKNHDEIGEKLSDLKNIILRYYTTSMPNKMYDALVDIYNCEEDLNSHRDIENRILVPMIAEIELRRQGKSAG